MTYGRGLLAWFATPCSVRLLRADSDCRYNLRQLWCFWECLGCDGVKYVGFQPSWFVWWMVTALQPVYIGIHYFRSNNIHRSDF